MKPPPLPAGIPAWCEDLPVRQSAYTVAENWAKSKGFPLPPMVERLIPDKRQVELRGVAPDGRAFNMGYAWTERQERELAYVSPIPKSMQLNYNNLDADGNPIPEERHRWPMKHWDERARQSCNPAGCRECYRERNWKKGQTHG